MDNLETYRSYFEQAYPNYSDNEYGKISKFVTALPTNEYLVKVLDTDNAKSILEFLTPLIKIKNYKSQIPFPVNIYDAIQLVVEIKNCEPSDVLFERDSDLFTRLLDIEGFQLPTVSAVFHFCHPIIYPIVDRNIEAACGLLSSKFLDEFDEVGSPTLPASTTSVNNKLSKYKAFIDFLSKLKNMHNEQHKTNYSFRELDKALMVYGVLNLKVAAENANKGVHLTPKVSG